MSGPTPNPDLHPVEAAQRQRSLILRVVRATFFILVVTFTLLAVIRKQDEPGAGEFAQRWWVPVIFSLLVYAVALAADVLTPNKKISTITGILVGVMSGMLATLALGWVLDLVLESWVPSKDELASLKPTVNTIKVLLGITLCYMGVSTVLQTQDDFRLLIPYVEFAKQIRGVRPALVDSSVLIDGRIVDIAATGFLQGPLVIPRAVIGELQAMADSADAMTRTKGRRGLDVIARLQRSPRLDVTVDETPARAKAVDQALVELARSMPALIMTLDVGLARVAAIQTVGVLNVNDLANALKSALVPGDRVTIKLIRPGEQPEQGVGYLADGTMIVAEDGARHVGEQVTLTVTSVLQTSVGRLVFGRVTEATGSSEPAPRDEGEPDTDETATHAEQGSPEDAPASQGEPGGTPARTPFPPRPPRSLRSGSPRNPRR